MVIILAKILVIIAELIGVGIGTIILFGIIKIIVEMIFGGKK